MTARALKGHLLRRAGFGIGRAERDVLSLPFDEIVEELLAPDSSPALVDSFIGNRDFVGVTTRAGLFTPNTVIGDARQRWLFRMIHSPYPLREKMTLFWHDHFATGYAKIAGAYGTSEGTRMMAARADEDPGRVRGQVEMLREHAMGSFRALLLAVARDPAMLVWLDGRTNVRARPQENFGRELLELFTLGIGFYTEADVLAAARVFTGWNLQRVGTLNEPSAHYEFFYNAGQHDTSAKTFTFPIYADGGRTIPARAAADGQQDGVDLIDALARHPETARRLARRFFAFFVSETENAPPPFVEQLAREYSASGGSIEAMLRALFTSAEFAHPRHRFARYASPVEFVVRAIKEAGWTGFSLGDTATPLSQMGQTLFEPPNVSGWNWGEAWFSSAAMLARLNFATTLARTQRAALAEAAVPYASRPEGVLAFLDSRFSVDRFEDQEREQLIQYALANGAWTGAATQLQSKVAGLAQLVMGSGEYQLL